MFSGALLLLYNIVVFYHATFCHEMYLLTIGLSKNIDFSSLLSVAFQKGFFLFTRLHSKFAPHGYVLQNVQGCLAPSYRMSEAAWLRLTKCPRLPGSHA